MKIVSLVLFSAIILSSGCSKVDSVSQTATPARGPLTAVTLSTQPKYPTVEITEYTLLTSDVERERAEAETIMQAKMEWPRAMQTKKRANFEEILAKNFTLHSTKGLLDRAAYIENRVNDPSKVKTAVYDNMVLQLFVEHAILTYNNVVEDEPGGPTAWKDRMTWMDSFVKEGGQWKIGSSRMINIITLNNPEEKPE